MSWKTNRRYHILRRSILSLITVLATLWAANQYKNNWSLWTLALKRTIFFFPNNTLSLRMLGNKVRVLYVCLSPLWINPQLLQHSTSQSPPGLPLPCEISPTPEGFAGYCRVYALYEYTGATGEKGPALIKFEKRWLNKAYPVIITSWSLYNASVHSRSLRGYMVWTPSSFPMEPELEMRASARDWCSHSANVEKHWSKWCREGWWVL